MRGLRFDIRLVVLVLTVSGCVSQQSAVVGQDCDAVLIELNKEAQQLLEIRDYETFWTDSLQALKGIQTPERKRCLQSSSPETIERIFGNPDKITAPKNGVVKWVYSGFQSSEHSSMMTLTLVENKFQNYLISGFPPKVNQDGGTRGY